MQDFRNFVLHNSIIILTLEKKSTGHVAGSCSPGPERSRDVGS